MCVIDKCISRKGFEIDLTISVGINSESFFASTLSYLSARLSDSLFDMHSHTSLYSTYRDVQENPEFVLSLKVKSLLKMSWIGPVLRPLPTLSFLLKKIPSDAGYLIGQPHFLIYANLRSRCSPFSSLFP